MFGSSDVQLPQFDDEEIDRLLADTKNRSARLRVHRRRLRSVVTAACTAVVVALAATLAAVHDPTPTSRPTAQTTRPTNDLVAPHWKLVGDVVASWHEVSGLTGDPGLELSCPGVDTCYAAKVQLSVGGISSIEVTTDGGHTWTSSKLPVALVGPTHVVCANTSTCALLGLSATVSCPQSNLCQVTSNPTSTFEETTDGGATWTSHAGPASLQSLIGLSAMTCLSATSCVAVESGGYGTGASEMYVTTDGGQTWATEPMPTDFVSQDVRCASVTACFVTGFDQSPGGSQTAPGGTVLYTTDGGATWTTASLPSGIGAFSATSCADASHCLGIFSGSDGQRADVLSSTDTGSSWTSLTASGLPDGVVLSTDCPTANQCWAAGITGAEASAGAVTIAQGATGMIASTTDGGQTWQSVPPPDGITQVASLSCPSPTNCYALAFENSTSPGMSLFTVVLLSYSS